MANTLHTYATPPVDFWDGWISLPSFLRRLVGYELAEEAPFSVCEFMAFLLEAAHTVATQPDYTWGNWEGDVRRAGGDDENMYVALRNGRFPRAISEIAVAWKQDNNGSTYFVSCQPIPSLSDEDGYDASAPQL